MISFFAFSTLVYLALAVCVLAPCLLLALLAIDFIKEELW